MSIQKVNGLIGVVALISSGVAFGQTQVPNDFTAGTPARAAEVNANFDALETAVDQNATDIQNIPAGPQGIQGDPGPQGVQGVPGPQGPAGADLSNEVSIIQGEQAVQNDRLDAVETSVDGNAAEIGVNAEDIATNSSDVQANTTSISDLIYTSGLLVHAQGTTIGRLVSAGGDNMTIVSETGYLVPLTDVSSNTPHVLWTQFYYTVPNCSGVAYVSSNAVPSWVRGSGYLIMPYVTLPAPLFYLARGNTPQSNVTYQSVRDIFDTCTNLNTPGTTTLYAVLPNDESITGFSNPSMIGPLMIGSP